METEGENMIDSRVMSKKELVEVAERMGDFCEGGGRFRMENFGLQGFNGIDEASQCTRSACRTEGETLLGESEEPRADDIKEVADGLAKNLCLRRRKKNSKQRRRRRAEVVPPPEQAFVCKGRGEKAERKGNNTAWL